MVDIVNLVEIMISYLTVGVLVGPTWFPKWVGCHLDWYKWHNAAEYQAALELIAEAVGISVEAADKEVYDYACGKHGM